MTTLVIVRIRNCTTKFFRCSCSVRFDIFIERGNILSAFPKFVSYQMSDWVSEGIVHRNNLENNQKIFLKEEVVSLNAGNTFCNCSLIFWFKMLFYLQREKNVYNLKETLKNGYCCYKRINVQIKDSRENTFVILLFVSLSVEFLFCVFFFSQYACIK